MTQRSSGPTRRNKQTFPKHIKLTEVGRRDIEAWAQANQLNFSAAIETLALLGLEKEASSYMIPAMRATTLQGIRLAFNRLARLLSDIAIESAVNRTMSEGILLHLIRNLSEAHPDDFENLMRVPRDSRRQQDIRIRRIHDHIKQSMAERAAKRLRQPLAQIDGLLNEQPNTQ